MGPPMSRGLPGSGVAGMGLGFKTPVLVICFPFLCTCVGISPEQQVAYIGFDATFNCVANCPFINWDINPPPVFHTINIYGKQSTLIVNCNESTVVLCHAYCVSNQSRTQYVWNSSLLIQGTYQYVHMMLSFLLLCSQYQMFLLHSIPGCITIMTLIRITSEMLEMFKN